MPIQLVAPDILTPLQTVSPLYQGAGLLIGLLLWLLGGWGHRFWLVLATTLVAGMCGLIWGPRFGMQPLVAGLFLGIALGALALSLVRILIFLGSGLLAAWIAQQLAPGWNEVLACFLIGGVLGILLFRVWMTVLTSFIGSLLLLYNGLALAERFAKIDAVGLSARNGPLLNWTCLGMVGAGILAQYLILRKGGKKSKGKPAVEVDEPILAEEDWDFEVPRKKSKGKSSPPPKARSWWPWKDNSSKKAG